MIGIIRIIATVVVVVGCKWFVFLTVWRAVGLMLIREESYLNNSRSTSILNTRFCILNCITGQLPVLATVHEVWDSGIELFEHSMD